jgi:hypothetical protein
MLTCEEAHKGPCAGQFYLYKLDGSDHNNKLSFRAGASEALISQTH